MGELEHLIFTKQYSLVGLDFSTFDGDIRKHRLDHIKFKKWYDWAVKSYMEHYKLDEVTSRKHIDLLDFEYGVLPTFELVVNLPEHLADLISEHAQRKKEK